MMRTAHDTPTDLSPRACCLLAAAAVALQLATHLGDGRRGSVNLALLVLAVAAWLTAVCLPPTASDDRRPGGDRLVALALVAGLGFQLIALFARPPLGPGLVGADTGLVPLYVVLVATAVAAGALLPSGLRPDARHARVLAAVATPILLLAGLTANLAAIAAAASPVMDVVAFQQLASAELLEGANPYRMTFPDASFGSSPFYAPGTMAGGQFLFGFPYPPLSLLAVLPAAVLTADFRHAHALFVVAAAGIVAYASRRPAAKLAAAAILLAPAGPTVVAAGWTEPVVLAAFAAAVVLIARGRWVGGGVTLGLFWASKQYAPLTAPLALLLAGGGAGLPATVRSPQFLRLVGTAAAVAAIVTLPFVLWDPPAFWRSVVTVHGEHPFRTDALSLSAAYAGATGTAPPTWAGFAALAAATAVGLWRTPRTPAGYAAATAGALLVFFAFGKQAAANYYWLVAGMMLAAVALAGRGRVNDARAS